MSDRPDPELSKLGDDFLDDSAIERIASNVAETGPRVFSRARTVLRVQRVGGVAAVVLFVGVLVRAAMTSRGEPAASIQEPVASLSRDRACEHWSAPIATPAQNLLDLSGRALVQLSDGAVFRAKRLEPCSIAFEVDSGRILVHAKDLGGGELLVSTPTGSVRVVGTIFSVEHSASKLVVEVGDGTVEVSVGEERAALHRGERAIARKSVLVRDLLADRGEALRRAIDALDRPGPPPSSSAPLAEPRNAGPRIGNAEPGAKLVRKSHSPKSIDPSAEARGHSVAELSADELVSRAAKRRQAGDLDGARSSYRSAGSMSGPTAEAAWIALARLELSALRFDEALVALDERERRFPSGDFAVEAAWIGIQVDTAAHHEDRARQRAIELQRRWPASVQSDAAKRWIQEHSK
ncbi:MAG: FecR domain-containing protein [Deltaproteobacteria bacterium]|nr:FecR domain-containing protein [Deltaproteobacteria bacterium]